MDVMNEFELSREFRYAMKLGYYEPSGFLRCCFRSAQAALEKHPGHGWRALSTLDVPPNVKEQFDIARAESGIFALRDSVIMPPSEYPLELTIDTGDESVSMAVDDADALAMLHDVMSGEWQHRERGAPPFLIARELVEAGMLTPRRTATLDCSRPGIYRLQHASLLFRSSSTTILVDPVCHGGCDGWLDPRDLPKPDAVLISHSHHDHFCLRTLLHFPRDVKMIVPHVAQRSMLCPDMAQLLRDAGFVDVVSAPWFSRHMVGDIPVSAYPFYGEQPWLTFESPLSQLRNVGNTYVIRVDDVVAWILVDSGDEFGAGMRDLCARVLADVGQVDVVFSNLREFVWHAGQIDGSGRYLFCFPMEYLERPHMWPRGRQLTLGSSGVRELLADLEARYFFPYAHWWHARSDIRHVVDRERTEAAMVASVAEAKSTRPLQTKLGNWMVGQRLSWRNGDPTVEDDLRTMRR